MSRLEKFLKLKGFSLKKAQEELGKTHQLSVDEFHTWAEQKKWDIYKFHLENNPFYKSFTGKATGDWEEIPIIGKGNFQEGLDLILTPSIKKSNLYFNNTSGSSGHPFRFAKDKFSHAMTWALISHRYHLHNLSTDSRQARFYGIPLTRKGYYKEKIKDKLSNRVRFPVFDLSDKALEVFLKMFEKDRFELIYGYTNSLVMFAKFLLSRNLVLKEICPTLRKCIVTSEVCTPEDRVNLEAAYGVKVVNEYGASELDLIAFEDQDYDWITNVETLHIEIVDEAGKTLSDGEEGRVVITSLYNRAMPFIRYEIGDIGSLLREKKGIYPIFNQLAGRLNDTVILPSGKKSPGLAFYYVSKSLLEKSDLMKEFIIRQTAKDLLIFDYVATRDLTAEERQEVHQMIDLYLEKGLRAEFNRKEFIERPVSGKIKHFYSEL